MSYRGCHEQLEAGGGRWDRGRHYQPRQMAGKQLSRPRGYRGPESQTKAKTGQVVPTKDKSGHGSWGPEG